MPSPFTIDLSGQVAIVTGSSSGIGAASAKALAAAGAKVCINYHSDEDGARAVEEEIKRAGGHAIAVGVNVSHEDRVEHLFAKTKEAFGDVHILVANAGLQKDGAADTLSLKDWNTVLDVNLTGQFLCCREAIRHFLARGRQPELSRALGKIICMSSVHQVIPWGGHVNYATSKGGIMLMMKTLAQEYANRGIRINAICPGAIKTDINKSAWSTAEGEKQLLKLIPYGRVGVTDDIANAVVWLSSDLSDYVTGASLFVDGGMTLYPGFEDNG